MKVVNRKKLASTIMSVVAAVAAITSVSAFAEAGSTFQFNYSLTPHGVADTHYTADQKYMFLNTRPSPPGSVNLTITRLGAESGITETFPAQVSRAPIIISTPEEAVYDVVISANGYATSGILFVKTSDNPNEPFYS